MARSRLRTCLRKLIIGRLRAANESRGSDESGASRPFKSIVRPAEVRTSARGVTMACQSLSHGLPELRLPGASLLRARPPACLPARLPAQVGCGAL